MNFFKQLPDNPWAWLILAIVSIIGLVFAYRSTPQKVLKFTMWSYELISYTESMLDDLRILYKGKTATKLTTTRITFWNNSFPTINGTDIVNAAPIIISLKHGEILDISVSKGRNTPNVVDVTLLNNKKASISFDYLDRKEGGIIQIIHTGYGDSINISGKIKGGKIKKPTPKTILRSDTKRGIVSLILAACLLFTTESQVFNAFPTSWYVTEEIYTLKEPYTFILICAICICFIVAGLSLVKITKNYIPKNCQ